MLRQNPAYRPGDPRILWALVMALLASCAPQIPRQEATPAPPPVVVEPPRAAFWRIQPSLLAREYRVNQRAVIVVTTDSGVVHDTTEVSTDLSIRHTTDGGAAGLLREVTLSSPGMPNASFPGVTLPLAFAVAPAARGLISSAMPRPALTGDPCRSPAEVPLGTVRELLVQYPDSLSAGTVWSDSGSYRTCRDGALLTVSSQRSFRVRSFSATGEGELTLERVTRTSLRGFRARGDDTTMVEGSGNATTILVVHSRTGAIVSGEGSGTLDLTVRGRTRQERARQTLESRIVRRTP